MFWERFYNLCLSNDTKPLPVVKELSISTGSITKWKRGTIPGGDTLVKISNYFGVTVDYLLGVDKHTEKEVHNIYIEKYMQLDATSKATVDNVISFEYEQTLKRAKTQKAVYYFPEYDIPVSAGTGIPLDYSNYELTELTVKPPKGANYIVTVSGDSMEPTFFNGDRLFIKKEASIEYGEIGLFFYQGDVYVKEYTPNGLLSHNSKYAIIDKNEDIQCLGKVLKKVEEV